MIVNEHRLFFGCHVQRRLYAVVLLVVLHLLLRRLLIEDLPADSLLGRGGLLRLLGPLVEGMRLLGVLFGYGLEGALLLEHLKLLVHRRTTLTAHLLHLSKGLVLLLLLLLYLLEGAALLEPLCVSEGVQGVVTRRTSRADTRKHHYLGLFTLHKGVTQDHGQFGGAERYVLALRGLPFLSVKGPDAFFQG